MAKRETALSKGILQTSGKDEVAAQLIVNDQDTLIAETRLKGDWVDHLEGDKWSFRIKLKGDGAFMGMRKFSVQDPKVRAYLKEWVFHEMLRQEGILAGKYDFVELKINGETKGVFNIEEHFAKEMLESQERREGPILKFNEDNWWASLLANDLQHAPKQQIIDYNSAEIEAFGMKRTLRDSLLKESFLEGRNKLAQAQQGKGDIENIFDLDKMARFVAITDICGAHHGFVWHNFRFYFNPITRLLEPIGFDGFGGLHESTAPLLTLSEALTKTPIPNDTHEIKSLLSRDRIFVEKYIDYLKQYSHKAFIKNFIDEKSEAYHDLTRVLRNDVPNFHADWAFLNNQAQEIRQALAIGEKESLKVYRSDRGNEIVLQNFHSLPLEIIGLGNSKTIIRKFGSKPVIAGYLSSKKAPEIKLRAIGPGKHIYARVIGTREKLVVKIKPYPAVSAALQSSGSSSPLPKDIFKVKGQDIVVSAGEYVISEDIVIPKGPTVIVEAGATFILQNNASIISHSALFFGGKADNPVVIKAAIGSKSGIAILQANKSVLYHTQFENLSNPSNAFTGGVSFFETEVEMNQCSIRNAKSEDGLNIVRSHVSIDDLRIENTFSDAFDCDFCTGTINQVAIENSGNDALDFSGSKLKLSELNIQNAGDKGLSCGEASNIVIQSGIINGAKMGIAAKDNSTVLVMQIAIDNSENGFVAYQKKPVYGPASIEVKNYALQNVNQAHLIERASTLQLQDQFIEGQQIVEPSFK